MVAEESLAFVRCCVGKVDSRPRAEPELEMNRLRFGLHAPTVWFGGHLERLL